MVMCLAGGIELARLHGGLTLLRGRRTTCRPTPALGGDSLVEDACKGRRRAGLSEVGSPSADSIVRSRP